MMPTIAQITNDDCKQYLLCPDYESARIDFTFLGPPFNQGENYRQHNNSMLDHKYWDWMKDICGHIYKLSSSGAAIYFMQREKMPSTY